MLSLQDLQENDEWEVTYGSAFVFSISWIEEVGDNWYNIILSEVNC